MIVNPGGAAEEGLLMHPPRGRIHAWEAAFNMAIRNPMTGVGLSMFLDNYWDYATHSRAEGKAHVTHSTWFQVMAEAGLDRVWPVSLPDSGHFPVHT